MSRKLLMLATAAAVAFGAWAATETETVDGRTWKYRIDGDEVVIADVSPATGAVTIPSTLGGKPVTWIGQSAFFNCAGLRSVTIPDSVMHIGESAFTQCRDLTNVTFGSGVTRIGESAFSDCHGLASVTIPNSVTRIGREAFWCCCSLTSVTIPASVTDIEPYVFAHCSKLTEITLPMWCKKNMYIYYSFSDYAWRFTPEKPNGIETKSWQEYLSIPSEATITYKDVGGGSSGGDVAEIWKKAQTFNGAVFRGGKAVGVVQVKVGKASKKGEVSVSGTITGLDGKKLTAKGGKVAVNGESATATLAVKDGTSATVTVGKDGISGSWKGAAIRMADIGGDWTRTGAKVRVTAADLPAGAITALLPNGEPVIPKGGKWSFAKNTTVKLSKDKTTYVLDDAKGKTNRSSMKLTYTPKTGVFKGSFKLYALEGADGKKKLKKYTVNVTGLVVDGKGQGEATCKKPKLGPWAVTVD